MTKIRACIEKKVPQPDKNYSSQSVGASLEIEVPEEESGDSVRQRLRQLYGILASEVEAQIARMNSGSQFKTNGVPMPAAQNNRLPARNLNGNGQSNGNGHTNGNGQRQSSGVPATASQQKRSSPFARASASIPRSTVPRASRLKKPRP